MAVLEQCNRHQRDGAELGLPATNSISDRSDARRIVVDPESVYFKETGPHSRAYVIFKTGADTQFVPDAK